MSPFFRCNTCARCFGSDRALFQHMDALNHFEWECSVCSQTLPTEDQRTQHEHDFHNHCGECQRTFFNQNNLKMHLRSRTHLGQQMQCPFCKRCFTTATGITHHVESGSCPNTAGLNRETLYRFIRNKDSGGTITNNQIGWHDTAEYMADDRSYNCYRDGWECYLCNRLFQSLYGLNQHLKSPAHQQNLYHCPKRICRREFKTLAGIINHLESESCGYTRFEQVQSGIQDMMTGNRMIGF